MMTQMTVLPLGEKYCHYRHLRHWKVVIQMTNERVPVWEKANLSLEEAAAYFGIGINKLRYPKKAKLTPLRTADIPK